MAQPRRNLSVELRVINCEDVQPIRVFSLKSPTYAIRIGRGSKSGNRDLYPARHNAWFDSRVMSREHAVLKADPDTRAVYIEDVGSMHGTYVDDRKVTAHERHPVYDDDIVKFGSEVTRGPESFPPLHVVVGYSWDDEALGKSQVMMSRLGLAPNSFQVPDFDDEGGEEDDDISFVQETVLKPKLEAIVPSPARAGQEATPNYIEEASSEVPGQGIIDLTRSTSQSCLPSYSIPQLNHSPIRGSSPAVRASVIASVLSGLSDAERQADKQAMNLDELPTSSIDVSISTDLPSPVKSNSSLPTSSQTEESDTHPNAKVEIFNKVQTPTPHIGLEKSVIVVDEDLTQSESGSDEVCSSDIMVDDSEEELSRDAPTDYGSDSDEEALMMADNRGTKLPRVMDESTDSESSQSEVSDDIGMDREEDFFDHSDSQPPAAKEVGTAGVFDHFEKAPTEKEPIPYNMRPGNFALPCTRLTSTVKPLNRAPSPSDAALAKTCDLASGNTGGPGSPGAPYAYTTSQSWSHAMASAYNPAWPCTFDGRTHVPYDDRFGGFPYAYNAVYAPEQITAESYRTFPSTMAMIPEHGFNPDHNSMKQSGRNTGSPRPQPNSLAPNISSSSGANMTQTGIARFQQNTIPSTAKVSINSIVDQASEKRTPSLHPTTLKRKADEMFGNNSADLASEGRASEGTEQDTQTEYIRNPACHSLQKTVTPAQIKALQNMPSVKDDAGERPAKRARLGKETGRSSFTTLVVTALAGAVVGGVGVVAALVALPQDFFV